METICDGEKQSRNWLIHQAFVPVFGNGWSERTFIGCVLTREARPSSAITRSTVSHCSGRSMTTTRMSLRQAQQERAHLPVLPPTSVIESIPSVKTSGSALG